MAKDNMEDYKKKYEDIVDRIKTMANDQDQPFVVRKAIEEQFPKIVESEDEKTKRMLNIIAYKMSQHQPDIFTGEENEWFYAWTEKLGEQKSISKIPVSEKLYEYIRNICACIDDAMSCESIFDVKNYIEQASKDAQDAFGMIEKQGEQNTIVVIPKFRVGDVIRPKGSTAEYTIESISGECYHGKGWGLHISCDNDYELVEQKPDKVESKFREGEWLCENEPNNYARFIQILEIVNVQGKDRYRISRDIHKDENVVEFGFVEKYYHKFDIQNAKAGDVLVYCNEISIYKDIIKTCTENDTKFGGFTYYCCYDGNLQLNSLYSLTSKDEENIHPATKEQRDLLFQKMHDAGYEWDAEKLELKKIEQKLENKVDTFKDKIITIQNPAWSEKELDSITAAINNLEYLKNNYVYHPMGLEPAITFLKSLKDRVQPQSKQEWSKDDEYYRNIILYILNNECVGKTDKENAINWFNSLKERISNFDDGYKVGFSAAKYNQWKPSDLQMEAMQKALVNLCGKDEHNIITGLYYDLKKLKGE